MQSERAIVEVPPARHTSRSPIAIPEAIWPQLAVHRQQRLLACFSSLVRRGPFDEPAEGR